MKGKEGLGSPAAHIPLWAINPFSAFPLLNLGRIYSKYHPHFTDEEKEAQRMKTKPRLHINRIQCAASRNIASRHPCPLFFFLFFPDLLRHSLTR